MAKKIQIKKTVLDRNSFKSTINNKFAFFRNPDPIIDPDTVGELFRLYDKLYLEVPIEGENQSHEYLVKKSSELYQIDSQLETIQPLLDEVAQLRQQILDANGRIIELETQLANGTELNFGDAEQLAALKIDLAAANANVVALEQSNKIANEATKIAQEQAEAALESSKKVEEVQEEARVKQQLSSEVAEIEKIIKNWKKDDVGRAFRFISKKWSKTVLYQAWNYGYNSRIRWATRYKNKYFWLFGKDQDDKSYPSTRKGNYGGSYFIPATTKEADDMTLDFFVAELEQAGYKASSIVQAVENRGNMKGRVRFRVITFKDEEKEDKVGYRLVK